MEKNTQLMEKNTPLVEKNGTSAVGRSDGRLTAPEGAKSDFWVHVRQGRVSDKYLDEEMRMSSQSRSRNIKAETPDFHPLNSGVQ